jgi:SAM-dependent methyltransferase
VNERLGERDLASELVEHLGLAPGDFVVDVACGTGQHLTRFREHVLPGGRALGVDFSFDAARSARALTVEVLVGQGDDLPLQDACADAVSCNFAVYYLPSLDAALREWRRILRPGGRLVVSGPASDTNAELYRFHSQATGCGPSDADRMALGYVEGPVLRGSAAAGFEDVRLHRFTNRVTFPDAGEFLAYWCSTSLFQRTPGAAREQGETLLARRPGPFVVTKHVSIATARRS